MRNMNGIDDRIIELMVEILELDEPVSIQQTDRLREDLGMDSLGSMELLSRLSEELELDLDMQDAMAISTVKDACLFIESNYRLVHGHATHAG